MNRPVFIVGAPRSGTTMLAAMLSSHSQFAAGPETQFFSKLSHEALQRAIDDPDWPRLAVQTLSQVTLAEQPVTRLFKASGQALHSFLSTREPSVAAMLEALTVPFARARGKPIWVEKTPNHLLHLPTIRRLWPDSRIVRIVRDPRDVALSACRLPTFSKSILANIYLWRRWHDIGEAFIGSDAHCFTLRFASLVSDPEKHLSDLCDFLGVDFESSMLDFQERAKDVSSRGETWKKTVSTQLDKDRAFAWKRSFPQYLRRISDMVTYEWLQRFDYECTAKPSKTRYAYRMSRNYVESCEALLLRDAERGLRWLPTEDPLSAAKIVDAPKYGRFDDPSLLARFCFDRSRDWLSSSLSHV